MAGVQKVCLIGNLGQDPQLHYSKATNIAVAKLSLAVSEKRRDRQGQWRKQTEWYKVLCFGGTAENYVAKYLKKGQLIYVDGELEVERWINKEGKNQVTLKIITRDIQGFGGGIERGGNVKESVSSEESQEPQETLITEAEPAHQTMTNPSSTTDAQNLESVEIISGVPDLIRSTLPVDDPKFIAREDSDTRCDDCDGFISKGRRQASPHSTVCVSCQRAMEASKFSMGRRFTEVDFGGSREWHKRQRGWR